MISVFKDHNSHQQELARQISNLEWAASRAAEKRVSSGCFVTPGGHTAANSRQWERDLAARIHVEELAKRSGQINTLRRKLARISGTPFKTPPAPIFVIVPCGKSKVFDRPNLLSKLPLGMVDMGDNGEGELVQAQAAYVSRVFKLSMAFARHFGDTFRILSAKYGLLEGHSFIENYDASFHHPNLETISMDGLKEQAKRIDWKSYSQVLALGGKAYRIAVEAMLPQEARKRLFFPFAGLDLPRLHRALTQAVEMNNITSVREFFELE